MDGPLPVMHRSWGNITVPKSAGTWHVHIRQHFCSDHLVVLIHNPGTVHSFSINLLAVYASERAQLLILLLHQSCNNLLSTINICCIYFGDISVFVTVL